MEACNSQERAKGLVGTDTFVSLSTNEAQKIDTTFNPLAASWKLHVSSPPPPSRLLKIGIKGVCTIEINACTNVR